MIRGELSAVTHAKTEWHRKLGLDTTKVLAKSKSSATGVVPDISLDGTRKVFALEVSTPFSCNRLPIGAFITRVLHA